MSHLVKPPFGLGWYFNGTDAYIEVPNSDVINLMNVHRRTLIVWFKANDVVKRQVIYEEGGTVNGFNIYIDNEKLYCGFWGTAITNTWLSIPFTDTSDWHVVIFVFDGDNGIQKVYLDGVEVASSNKTGYVPTHSGKIGIGAMNNDTYFHDGSKSGTGYYFNGIISEERIYNRVLTETEISDLYSIRRNIMDECVLKLGTVGLVRGGGTQWLDESPYGNHATVHGAIRVRCCHCNPVVRYGTATPI